MENVKEFKLANGLTILIDEDENTPLVTVISSDWSTSSGGKSIFVLNNFYICKIKK